jgi:hypothetical protein
VLKVLVRSFIVASVLGAVITLLTLLYSGTRITYPGGHFFISYGYPLGYFSVWRSYASFSDLDFINAFEDFVFYYAIVFVIVSLLSLTFQKLGTRKRGQITSLEIENKNEDRHPEEHDSLFFTRMNGQNNLKMLRLLFLHNLVMTFLLVLGITWGNAGGFWGSPRTGWLILNNVIEFASWIYWVVGLVPIFLYAKRLDNSKPLARAMPVLNK